MPYVCLFQASGAKPKATIRAQVTIGACPAQVTIGAAPAQVTIGASPAQVATGAEAGGHRPENVSEPTTTHDSKLGHSPAPLPMPIYPAGSKYLPVQFEEESAHIGSP